jgi:hypothetical protein
VQVGELLASQEAAFGKVHAAFHLAFVLGRPRSVGADQEAVVLRLPTVRLAEHRVVQVGLEHRGFEIVDDDPTRCATEPLERMPMAREPGADLLVEDELGVLVAAVAERHHEDPCAARSRADGIEQGASESEIDLRLLARQRVHTHHRFGLGRLQRPHEATDRRVAAGVTQPGDAVEHGHHLDTVVEQLLDLLPIRLDARRCAGWLGWWTQARRQLRRVRAVAATRRDTQLPQPAGRTSGRSSVPDRDRGRSRVGSRQHADDGPVREGNARVVAPLWPLREGTPERVLRRARCRPSLAYSSRR